MLGEMPRLPVHGDGDARLHPAVHLLQLLAAGMAGDVHQRVAVGDDLAAQIDEPVLDAPDGTLVAGNGARGEDDEIALVAAATSGCWSSAMRASAARGSPWLPVHSSTTSSGLQVGEVLLVVILEIGRQIARVHGHADDAMHGPARHHQLPPGAPWPRPPRP